MSDAPRVVFDCNTFLQALSSPGGPAGSCVQLAFNGKVRLFVSPAVLDELRDVTSRPKVIQRLELDSRHVEDFFEAIGLTAVILDVFPSTFAYDRDPDDAHYVNLALAANANLIVSRDKDLLELMDSTRAEGADFQARFPQLKILTPVGFLRQLAQS